MAVRLAEQFRPPRLGPSASELTDRGRELLDELEAIFVEEGFAHFTVGELAARLRCSRRTLYDLAPSKDELVLVVLDRRLRRAGRLFRQRAEALDDPADVVEALMAADVTHAHHASLRFSQDVDLLPAARRLTADHYRYATRMLQDIVEDGIERRRFRNLHAPLVAEVIDAALARLREPDVLRTLGLTFGEAATELSTLLREGLVADRKARRRSN